MSIAQSLQPELAQELAVTRKVLTRLPDANFGYKPHPKSMDAGSIANHIATMLHWGDVTLRETEFDVAPGGVPVPQIHRTTSAEVLADFDKNVAEFHAELARTNDSAMMQPWALKQNGAVFFEMPRAAVIRAMILNHIIHHRAQLCVYLRLLNLPVPAVYGPSADEPN